MAKDVYQLVKDSYMDNSIPEYPERALYETFIKLNADHWFTPKNCNVGSCCNFGRSVVPYIYDDKIHDGLILAEYRGGIKRAADEFLKHQIYLHDLVRRLWMGERYGYKVDFEITCIRKSEEKVKLT